MKRGLIKVYKLDPEGRKQVVLHVEGPGRVLAEVALFLERPTYPASAEALEESEVLAIPKERFFQLLEVRPQLARSLIRYLARRQERLLHLLDRLVFHEVRERLCEFLLERLAEEGQGFRLPTNPELAALLGTVPGRCPQPGGALPPGPHPPCGKAGGGSRPRGLEGLDPLNANSSRSQFHVI